jgi:hypothetical protein
MNDDAPLGTGTPERVRLVALAFLVAFWLAPWAEIQTADGGVVLEAWRARTGAAGGLALAALWGLAATTLAARTRRGLRIGAAWTDAAVASAATALLLLEHRWIPGGEIRDAWVPIFAPLALLGVLDALRLRMQPDAGGEVTAIRGGAALFAAGTLVVGRAYLPAAVAFGLALSPLALLLVRRPTVCRAIVEAFVLVGAGAAVAAPAVQESLVGVASAVTERVFTRYGWNVTALVVGVTAILGMVRSAGRARA